MVKAYRDTWELGLHSYLTYMRDRLLLARELLASSGSVFVQISDENVHHMRELMDEVFGDANLVSIVVFSKTSGATAATLPAVQDYLLWYARQRDTVKYRQVFEPREAIENPYERYICVQTSDGTIVDLSLGQKQGKEPIPEGRLLRLRPTDSQGETADSKSPVVFHGREYFPPRGRHWSVTSTGTRTTRDVREVVKSHLNYVVADTKVWEQSAAYILDTHPAVEAFVKNAGLGFAVPYLHNGQPHDYVPDFIVRLKAPLPRYLILETKGYDELAEVKQAAAERWVAAVNADGQFGRWAYAMAKKVADVRAVLDRAGQ
jgi:hypothetical protein